MSRDDVPWAVCPGETLPPAPPLWVCDDRDCGCMDTHTWPETEAGARPMGWRMAWNNGREVTRG